MFGDQQVIWRPERPIFGKVRYMSSENTTRKLRVSSYIEQYRPSKDSGLERTFWTIFMACQSPPRR